MTDIFAKLGLSPDATAEEIAKRFRVTIFPGCPGNGVASCERCRIDLLSVIEQRGEERGRREAYDSIGKIIESRLVKFDPPTSGMVADEIDIDHYSRLRSELRAVRHLVMDGERGGGK